jgi:adenylate kinase family enzyme
MDHCRLHVTGAAGTGTTTLGQALAGALAMPHHDADDYVWLPTPERFEKMRPEPDRLRLMEEMFLPSPAWVLSGSVIPWGESLGPLFDAVIFLRVPTPVRMERLRHREMLRHGPDALCASGPHHAAVTAFLNRAERYDDPHFDGTSLARHRAWLMGLKCPVLELDGTRPTDDLVDRALHKLNLRAMAEAC